MYITKSCITFITIIATTLLFSVNAFATDYQHSITVEDITLDWKIDGETMAIKLSAKTNGWVGIGFNPESRMKGANIILGYVKKGEVKISDEFGHKKTMHKKDTKLGGENNVTLIKGSEEGKITTLEFTIPLNSSDSSDGSINPSGDNTVLLAYGERDSRRSGHAFNETITLNLATGVMK